jgi:hypothetical protein
MRGEFEYKVEDVSASIGEVRKEWGKYLARISFNKAPARLNLRSLKLSDETKGCGTGIALDDDEWDAVADALINMGYGNTKTIKEAIDKRPSFDDNFFSEGDKDEP